MRPARWQVALALCFCAASGCNLVLGNDKRSLAVSTTDPSLTPEAGPTGPPPPAAEDAAVDGGADSGPMGGTSGIDGGPMMSTDPRPDSGPTPAECASPDHLAECVPGKTQDQTQLCGHCDLGRQMRTRLCGDTCGWGPFTPWTDCQIDGEVCESGQVQQRIGTCGPCNTGKLISRRTCSTSCRWSPWSAEVCEPDPLYCTPGTAKSLPDTACGQRCGVIKQTQTCNATCTWNAPVKTACMEAGVCTPGATEPAPDAPCNEQYCNKGVQTQSRTCTSMCTWGQPTGTGCFIPDNICRPTDLDGMGYRCRPNEQGFGELCNLASASAALRCTFGPRQRLAQCQ